MVWGVVREEGGHAVCLTTVRVHRQLLPEGLLLASIGKPVVDAHLGDQVSAEPLCFGWRYTSLDTLRPGQGQERLRSRKLGMTNIKKKVRQFYHTL